ncbi:Uncharacterised protein [Burkholderia pseudomallei]|nr:Uncharacterised protein [Burkholderia pseudomallei]
MRTFDVELTELLNHAVRVEAYDEEQARERAIELVEQADPPLKYLTEPRLVRAYGCKQVDNT